MDGPFAGQGLVAGWGKYSPVVQLYRLVLYWAQNTIGKSDGVGPCFAIIVGGHVQPPPFLWTGTNFIEQIQGLSLGFEQDGIPAREPRAIFLYAIDYFDRGRPTGTGPVCDPNTDVLIFFFGTAEPR